MRTLYVSSFYQLCQVKYSLTEQNKLELSDLFDVAGAIIVSHSSLEKVNQLMKKQKYSSLYEEYLTALYCDIEVALEERNIIRMAEIYGFKCEILSRAPAFNYQEDFNVYIQRQIMPEDLHSDDVFIINTHGKKQKLDGPYQQAIYSSDTHIRIVIAACSSGAGTFPITGSNLLSPVQMVADEAIKYFQSNEEKINNLQIVGFIKQYQTDNTENSAVAIFAKKEIVIACDALILMTPQERIKQKKGNIADLARAKFNSYKSSSLIMSLKDMYSNVQSSFLTKEFTETFDSPIVKLLCPPDSSLEQFHSVLVETLHSKEKRESYKSELKKQRNKALDEADAPDLLSKAKQVSLTLNGLFSDERYRACLISLQTLELAIIEKENDLSQQHPLTTKSSSLLSEVGLFAKGINPEKVVPDSASVIALPNAHK